MEISHCLSDPVLPEGGVKMVDPTSRPLLDHPAGPDDDRVEARGRSYNVEDGFLWQSGGSISGTVEELSTI